MSLSPSWLRTPISLLIFLSSVAAVHAAGPPNILLVLSDDHSVPDLGCYGNHSTVTPNLDKFSTEGMKFTGMFTSAPQCAPSRATLLTGRSPVADRMSRFSSPLPGDVDTLPALLHEQLGYYTGVCRRYYHLDGPKAKLMTPFLAQIYKEHDLQAFKKRLDFVEVDNDRSLTPPMVKKFFSQVPQGKPWFFWVSFNDPHDPWDKDKWSEAIDPAKIKVPPYMPDLPGVRGDLRRFYGEVDRMDEEFGWIMDLLNQHGDAANTIVVFMGDNGYAVMRGKGTLYDPGLNVPCIVRWPGQIKPGTTSHALLSGEDLVPTLLAAVGLKPTKQMTGRSFLDNLLGKSDLSDKYIYGERAVHGYGTFTWKTRTNDYDFSRCVRSDRFKLIYNATPWIKYAPCVDDPDTDTAWQATVAAEKAGTLPELFRRLYFTNPRPIYEFYDLANDPYELNNVSGHPEFAKQEAELRHAMIEKMLVDFDYLPLPAE